MKLVNLVIYRIFRVVISFLNKSLIEQSTEWIDCYIKGKTIYNGMEYVMVFSGKSSVFIYKVNINKYGNKNKK